MNDKLRPRWLLALTLAAALAIGTVLAWPIGNDERDGWASRCAGTTLTPSDEVTCLAYGYLTAPTEPPEPAPPDPMPGLVGKAFPAAQKLLANARIEYTWLRLHHELETHAPLASWLVCHQYPDMGESTDVEDVSAVILVGAACPDRYPDLNGKSMAEASAYLDRQGLDYLTLDAGDDDFPGLLDAKDTWTMCFIDIPFAIERAVDGSSGVLYEEGDTITLESFVAPTAAGCSASNEAEEQGDPP